MREMRLLETMQVGPFHAGHSRTIYAGAGMEMWHEMRVPLGIGAVLSDLLHGRIPDSVELFVADLPAVAPADCASCGLREAYYSDAMLPTIVWEGADALDKAEAWLAAQGVTLV